MEDKKYGNFYLYSISPAPGTHPTNFTGTALNSTHIYLTWEPPPPDQVNGVIREYQLNVTENATGIVLQYTTNATDREITVGPLHPYYIYHCSVNAITISQGPYTSEFDIQTEEDSKFVTRVCMCVCLRVHSCLCMCVCTSMCVHLIIPLQFPRVHPPA